MSFDAETLFRLLPAIHRIRDAEIARETPALLSAAEALELASLETTSGLDETQQARLESLRERSTRGPLKALIQVVAEQLEVVEENIAQLYDDLFIETCGDWVVPYIGDLLGYEPLHALGGDGSSGRAEVAHVIALRRRKGTVSVLEQLARDVSGWNARAVEFFALLGATQYMNHPRPNRHYAPDLRHAEALSRIGSAFDSVSHTIDVRRIDSGRGRFNVPNVGIFLWRLFAYRHTRSPAVRVDDRRYLVSPLGQPFALFSNPIAEEEITHLAEPNNVPEPLARRLLSSQLSSYYGTRPGPSADVDNADPSLILFVDGAEVPRAQISICDLSDDGAGWAHVPPAGHYSIDPVLGRVALAPDVAVPTRVELSYHYGFSADLGGGEYSRELSPAPLALSVPDDHATIGAALAALGGAGVIEITDSGRYEETLAISVSAGERLVLRARDGARPTLVLSGPLTIEGGAASACELDGLLVTGDVVQVPLAGNELASLRIAHSTLVPGHALDVTGAPLSPEQPSLLIASPSSSLTLERSIVGGIRAEGGELLAVDSIIDATQPSGVAYAALDGVSAAGRLTLRECTVVGKLHATEIGLISNCLLIAQLEPGDGWSAPIHAERRQTGCVRFSYLPPTAIVPSRFRCQPEGAPGLVVPRFTSLRYGVPAYCQLARRSSEEIRRGADDEGEMGAFHHLFPAQREANLRARLREFLRVGLNTGIFYET
jgi:hypothetical protein